MCRSQFKDNSVFDWLLRCLACLAGAVTCIIIYYLFLESFPALTRLGWKPFIAATSWSPSEGLYNILPMALASVFSTGLALLISAPLGFLSAIFLEYYAPPLIKPSYRIMVELLAGIPSVVYGFWGLTFLVPWLNAWHPPGASLLAGSIVLALMILPTIALMAAASLKAVPLLPILSARALGLSGLGLLRVAVFPCVKRGWSSALLLACGRALGETMAMVMVCGNLVQVPSSVFDSVRTLTANMALEMAYATGDHRAALFISGFILVALAPIVLCLVRLLHFGDHLAE